MDLLETRKGQEHSFTPVEDLEVKMYMQESETIKSKSSALNEWS